MKTRSIIILILVVALIGGFTYITLTNRPVDQIESDSSAATGEAGVYAMAEVTTHKTPADCWSAINGSVYDLSTWVSRHPGGPAAIESLCGTDGSVTFSKQHGTTPKPQEALILLKIGELK